MCTQQTPLVSVIIPTRNRADLLHRALSSVMQQTYMRLEIIVVDDASNDGTGAVVSSMADGRIRYIRHEISRGGAAARNTGIRLCTGDVIGFLDDDDEWEAEKTEEQLRLLRDYDAVITASNKSGDLSRFNGKKTVDVDDLRRGKFTAGGTGVLIAKASVLKETLFDESLPRYQDWDLFIRIALQCTIGYLNKPLVRYNEGGHARISNSLINYRIEELEGQLRMLHKHREFFGPPWFRRHMSRALLYGVKHRTDKWRLLLYVVRQYGPSSALRAVYMRARAVCRIKLNEFGTMRRATPRRSEI